MKQKNFKVSSKNELQELRTNVKPRFHRKYQEIKFSLPQKSKEENRKLTEEINDHYKACGCVEGSILGFVAVLGFIITLAINQDIGFQWSQIPMGIGVLFGGVTLGKLGGIWAHHLQLQKKFNNLLAAYEKTTDEEETDHDDIYCAVGRS